MKCKVFIYVMTLFFLLAGFSILNAGGTDEEVSAEAQKTVQSGGDSTMTVDKVDSAAVTEQISPSDKIIAYYFHGDRRCATCKKLEAYSTEAVQTGFDGQLKSGAIEWHVVNIDEEPNKHFIDDYKLYTKSVIVSHVVDGKETEWKNLEKIWELVGNKDEFMKYVQTEITGYLEKK
ncbi:MAG: nitrophenyl compound nitroreductase subunit ArsF family protein [Candidatus Zixiibacteriota bacterium]